MQVWLARQLGLADLHDRPDDDERPVRPRFRHGGEQGEVHALVHHPVKAEARVGESLLVRRFDPLRPRLCEMADIDAGREGVDIGMAAPFRLIEAVAAGEDDIRQLQQALFEGNKLRRRIPEVCQLVHAVIHGAVRRDMFGERKHHGRIIPAHQGGIAPADEIEVELALEHLPLRERLKPARQMGRSDRHARRRAAAHVQPGLGQPFRVHRLFPEGDTVIFLETAHQMLGPLKHKVPPQMAEAEEVERIGGVTILPGARLRGPKQGTIIHGRKPFRWLRL